MQREFLSSNNMRDHGHRYVRSGSILVEALVAAALCLAVVVGVISAFTFTLKSALANTAKVQATFLENEGLEAVRILRDNGWTTNVASQTSGTPFYLFWDGTTWVATSTNIYIDKIFERTVVLQNVNRDGSKNIVSSGGTLVANTRKVTISVSWRFGNATSTQSLSNYLTNIFNN